MQMSCYLWFVKMKHCNKHITVLDTFLWFLFFLLSLDFEHLLQTGTNLQHPWVSLGMVTSKSLCGSDHAQLRQYFFGIFCFIFLIFESRKPLSFSLSLSFSWRFPVYMQQLELPINIQTERKEILWLNTWESVENEDTGIVSMSLSE